LPDSEVFNEIREEVEMWLVLLLPMLWSLGLDKGAEGIRSSERNPILITWVKSGALGTEGSIRLQGTPEAKGRASAWIPVEDIGPITKESKLTFWVKGEGSPLWVRIIFRPKEGGASYLYWRQKVETKEEWRKVTIPLNLARPIWSSNYPYTLTPGKRPDLFLFFENWEAGRFDVMIDEIRLEEGEE